jgi:hypothetical protein
MNPNDLLPDPARRNANSPAEDTLRLIASLPAPAGLADRVRAGLRSAPNTGRVLLWRGPLTSSTGWMYGSAVRGAAAAAIVCLVAGGGWRIYSHVQPADAAKILVAPVSPSGNGFSNAGARRVPETLQGPILSHPVVPVPEINVVDKTPPKHNAGPPLATVKKKKSNSRPALAPVQ